MNLDTMAATTWKWFWAVMFEAQLPGDRLPEPEPDPEDAPEPWEFDEHEIYAGLIGFATGYVRQMPPALNPALLEAVEAMAGADWTIWAGKAADLAPPNRN